MTTGPPDRRRSAAVRRPVEPATRRFDAECRDGRTKSGKAGWHSDVNKDLTFKDKDKDQTLKAKDQDKDLTYKDKDQDKDQTLKAKDQDKDLTYKDKDQTLKAKDQDKDQTYKDKDLDKDCILVLKESLRTRTRTNITGVTSPGGYRQTTASCLGQLDLGLCVCCVVATLTISNAWTQCRIYIFWGHKHLPV